MGVRKRNPPKMSDHQRWALALCSIEAQLSELSRDFWDHYQVNSKVHSRLGTVQNSIKRLRLELDRAVSDENRSDREVWDIYYDASMRKLSNWVDEIEKKLGGAR